MALLGNIYRYHLIFFLVNRGHGLVTNITDISCSVDRPPKKTATFVLINYGL